MIGSDTEIECRDSSKCARSGRYSEASWQRGTWVATARLLHNRVDSEGSNSKEICRAIRFGTDLELGETQCTPPCQISARPPTCKLPVANNRGAPLDIDRGSTAQRKRGRLESSTVF